MPLDDAKTKAKPPEAGAKAEDAAAAVKDARAPMMSPLAMGVVFAILFLEGIVVYVVTSYVKSPSATGAAADEIEFVDLGEVAATLPFEGIDKARYFRITVAVYLSPRDREETKTLLTRLTPKLKDEIQSLLLQESYPNIRHPESKRRLKEKIKDLVVRMLGPERIDDVVLPVFEPQ